MVMGPSTSRTVTPLAVRCVTLHRFVRQGSRAPHLILSPARLSRCAPSALSLLGFSALPLERAVFEQGERDEVRVREDVGEYEPGQEVIDLVELDEHAESS